MNILTFVGYYLPGYKAGGPIRTLANMVDRLGDEFEFKIVTADRDFDDIKPYPKIRVDGWNRVGKAEVFYMSPKKRSLKEFKKILCSAECDVIYLNSFFSPAFTIKPLLLRRLGLIPKVPIIVAPRGEFSLGALGLKSFKKHVYIVLSKLIGLYRGVTWQASSAYEEQNIRRWFGDRVPVIIAPNLPPSVRQRKNQSPRREKTAGYLKIIFLSRVSRMKNLDSALKMLKGLNGKIQFNIYGPLEDMNYWAECQRIINLLPENIEVQYRGVVAHDQVASVIKEHHLFFLPTLGENFGHVILESLIAGCPILISDRTPWRGLQEKGVGWNISLDKPELFREVLQKCIAMDSETYDVWSQRAQEYGLQCSRDEEAVTLNRNLFQRALSLKDRRC